MKKIAYMFLIVGSLLIGANVVNAAKGGTKTHHTKNKFVSCADQTSEIKALVENPKIKFSKNETVEVKFSINAYNVIQVTEVKTSNPLLEKYIYAKLNGARIHGNSIELNDQTLNIVYQRDAKDTNFIVY